MKHFHIKYFFFLLPVLCILLFNGCGKSSSPIPPSPFSDASWNNTQEDIIAYEGDGYTTYDSVYGGICYTYPKVYQERQGTIKYMFDEQERLMCIAWTCTAEEETELFELYDIIEGTVNTLTNETDITSNAGHVWYREEGNIILSLMITSDLKALQYAYLHPDVSNPPKETN
ncbi:hypothetical protein D3Z45_06855 [Lachnospiraceae bacterium]|nr:hypothetical protein [Lachnospiraceae bacterium]